MKMQSRNQLIKSRWWWQHATNIFQLNPTNRTRRHDTKPLPLTPEPWHIGGKAVVMEHPFWRDGVEWGAYHYELARRTKDMEKFPTWPQLNSDEMKFVRLLLGKSNVLWWSCTNPQPGYSDAIHWNLSLSDGALRTGFLEWIAEQRQQHNVRQVKGRAGQSSKGPSWLWPEMLDLAANGQRLDRDFDSGTHSSARKLSEDCAARFMQALTKEADRSRLWKR